MRPEAALLRAVSRAVLATAIDGLLTLGAGIAQRGVGAEEATPQNPRLDRVISAGVTIQPRKAIFGSLRVRHFGPRPVIEDGSVNSPA